jgi:hypothetical protein
MSFSRRTLLKASAASAVLGGIGAPLVARAQAAEFTYKYANNLPGGHPMNARAKEMAAARSSRARKIRWRSSRRQNYTKCRSSVR